MTVYILTTPRLFTRLLNAPVCTMGWTYVRKRDDCPIVLAPISRRTLGLGEHRVTVCNCPPSDEWDVHIVESPSPDELIITKGDVPNNVASLLSSTGLNLRKGGVEWSHWALIVDVSVDLASTLGFMSIEDTLGNSASVRLGEGLARELASVIESIGVELPMDPLAGLMDFWRKRSGLSPTLVELIHGVRPWVLEYTLELLLRWGSERNLELPLTRFVALQLESLYASMRGREKFRE
jgi:hypothetical protein